MSMLRHSYRGFFYKLFAPLVGSILAILAADIAFSQESSHYSHDSDVNHNYEKKISGWLQKHNSAVAVVASEGFEGTAVVRIRIKRTGDLLLAAIDKTSGNPLIDSAVESMAQASDPFPPVPKDHPGGDELEFLVPIYVKSAVHL